MNANFSGYGFGVVDLGFECCGCRDGGVRAFLVWLEIFRLKLLVVSGPEVERYDVHE